MKKNQEEKATLAKKKLYSLIQTWLHLVSLVVL